MVNTGKPSTGCYLCRARRIKCDEAKPHCMRCQKSKRACPGYRDSFELNLRDETRATKKKAARVPIPPLSNYIYDVGQPGQQGPVINDWSITTYAEPHRDMERSSPVWSSPSDSSAAYSPTSSTSSTSSYIRSPYITSPSMCSHIPLPLPKSLGTPVDQQVMCFFLSHFVLVPEEGTPRGFFNFLLPLLQKEVPGSPMSVAFSAVALAAFGGRPSSRTMLPRADTLYVKALNKINVVLQDPKLASKDSTLAAVLLLAFYEARAILSEEHFWEASLTLSQTLTSTQLTIKGWVSHLEGAVALVKSRGKKQMETQVGRDMFLAIKSQMTMASIANSRRVNFGTEWWTTLEPPDDVIRVVNELNLRVADLRADCDTAISMVPRTPANIEIVTRLCREAEALEQEFSEWFESLPPNWRPSPVSWIDAIPEGKLSTSVCHPGRIDVFGELYLASRYIIALSSRLFVSATILRCAAWLCSPLDYRITPEYTVAARSCGQIIEDIVASVPYFFGWKPDIDIGPSKSHFVCGDDHFHTAKGLSGFFSLWPIFSAATSDFCTDTQRVWLRGRMVFIAESLGINQAALLLQAEQLRYPSMFIYRDAMNLPPSNCKVPQVPQSLPSSPASFPVSPESCHSTVGVDPNSVEESDWYLRLSEARMVQARHSINSSPAPVPSHKFAEFIAV